MDSTILWGAPGQNPPTTPVHLTTDGTELFVGTGVTGVRALLATTGAVQRTFAAARFPLLVHEGRLLAVTERGLSWFALEGGVEQPVEMPRASEIACHEDASQHCAFAARAEVVAGVIRVAHKRQLCVWLDGGAAMESRWVCRGEAALLRIDGSEARSMPEPPLPAAATADGYHATYRDAELHLRWEDSRPYLDYASPTGRRRWPLPPTTDGRLEPSLDGSVVGLSAPEVPAGNAMLRRSRIFDFKVGRLIELEGATVSPLPPFVATADTLIVNQLKEDALDEPTPTITAYDRATGKRRWREVLRLPPPPAR